MVGKIVKFTLFVFIVAVTLFFGYRYLNEQTQKAALLKGFAFGNGRIESEEVGIAAKVAGRLIQIYVNEGDIVEQGQMLAKLDTNELEAKLKLFNAQIQQAKESKNYSLAIVEQKQSEFALANENYLRAKNLFEKKAISLLQYQQEESAYKSARAAQKAANANVAQANEAINVAMAQAETIKVNIADSTLYAPIKGRILYKLAQNGEIIGSAKNVLIMLNLLETYMTIFLPTSEAGVVNYGSEVRIILDALPNIAIPAKVTFVSPKAQFTPKQIETQDEREKLMFRIKATVDYNLLKNHIEDVKTGLPGVAYIRLDKTLEWPKNLSNLPKSYVETSK
jgi:HlyD family secretion protein